MAEIVKTNNSIKQSLTKSDVLFQHRLAQTGLFEDAHLAELIDIARQKGPQFYTLGTLNEDGFGEKWQNGVLEDMPGSKILEAIKKGHFWLQLQGLKEIAPEYYSLASQGFSELAEQNSGFRYYKLSCNLLISSPSARVLCHLDCAEVILWHIRGRKRVYLYDLTKQAFASDETIENVIMRETEEEIPYEKEWDKLANVYDLEPGQAVNWPHFWPHRIDNIEGLNVSMQTEFYSDQGLRQYGVRYANGVLRRKVGLNLKSTSTTGPVAAAKAGIGLVSKKLGLQKPVERKITSRFTIDPDKLGAIKILEKTQQGVLDK